MLSIVPQILIFASLGVIIYIFAKKIPQLRELAKSRDAAGALSSASQEKKGSISRKALAAFGSKTKGLLVWLAESLIKRIKKLLHLVHFWLIKVKKGKKEDDAISEIEAKQELIMEEEKNLDKVINEDLAQTQVSEIAIFKEERQAEKRRPKRNWEQPEEHIIDQQQLIMDDSQDGQDGKIEDFFGEGTNEPYLEEQPQSEEPKQKSFLKRFWKKEKEEQPWQEDIYDIPSRFASPNIELDEAEPFAPDKDLSEGIIKVEKKPLPQEPVQERVMKEVVKVTRKPDEVDPDEELGIDRKILEKKIIQKITKNPRDPENYRQLGELYIKMKEFVDAEESYKQILRLTPRDIDAKRKLEKIKLLKRLQ